MDAGKVSVLPCAARPLGLDYFELLGSTNSSYWIWPETHLVCCFQTDVCPGFRHGARAGHASSAVDSGVVVDNDSQKRLWPQSRTHAHTSH